MSSPRNPPWLGPVLFGAFALLLGLFVGALTRDPVSSAAAAPQPARTGWAVEHRAAVLAGGQRLSWITVPSPQVPGDPLFDIHCLVMESATGAALSMICPGAEQGAFATPAPTSR